MRYWVPLLFLITSCSSAPKKDTPVLGDLEGKRVALIEVQAETTARKIVEVALVNQLIKNGTFILISKQEVDQAKAKVGVDTMTPKSVAEAVGAEFALIASVIEFQGDTQEGYSKEEVYDSALAQERGDEEGNTTKLYKVRSLEGKVQVELNFLEVATGTMKSAIASDSKKVTAEAKNGAAHLPPKLKFLEEIANSAFQTFFEKYR